MAAKSKARFSTAPVQHDNSEQQSSGCCSWLFGGRRSKDSHEEDHNSSAVHNLVPASANVEERYAAHSGKATHDVKSAAEDKEAKDFIERQRKKMEMEREKSMKRVESMLNRGL